MKKSSLFRNKIYLNLYLMAFSFSTYFCMYAFRKPFSVGTFDNQLSLSWGLDLDLKIAFILSQVFGYTTSKFIGIKWVSELNHRQRLIAVIGFIAFALVSLVGFATLSIPLKLLCMFLNGLPLGMIWGLTFSYLEGRRWTDILGAFLSVSFIISSGVVKSVGQWLINLGVSQYWMPAATGAIFFPFLVLSIFLLDRSPEPSHEEQKLKSKRLPMNLSQRNLFFKTYWPILIPLILLYGLVTAYRDFRDLFSRELMEGLGLGQDAALYSVFETPAALVVLVMLGTLSLVKNHRLSLNLLYGSMMLGCLIIGGSLLGLQSQILSPLSFMIVTGVGLYLVYVPFGCIFFDRFMAYVQFDGTSNFMIYICDAFGYLFSVALLLYRNFFTTNMNVVDFFAQATLYTTILSMLGLFISYNFLPGRLDSSSLKVETNPV